MMNCATTHKNLLALTVAALLALAAPHAQAAVLADGDVEPDPTSAEMLGVVDGGTLDFIIVGGTNLIQQHGTDAGTLTIDAPTFTDPLIITNDAVIGDRPFSLGQVIITGLNSEFDVQQTLVVGEEGQAFLEIFTGARVITGDPSSLASLTDPDFIVGNGFDRDSNTSSNAGAQGFVLIDGFASSLVSDQALIGNFGSGRVDLTNRARMGTRETAQLGVDAVGDGFVSVIGQGSRWNVGDGTNSGSTKDGATANANLEIGVAGRGGIEMLQQGVIRVENNAILGTLASGVGEATVSGQSSQFWVLGKLVVGDGGSGILNINDNGLVRVDNTGGGGSGVTIGATSFVNMAGGTLRAFNITPGAGNGSPSVTAIGEVANNGDIRGGGRIESTIVNSGSIQNQASIANTREHLIVTGAVTNNDNIVTIGGEMTFQQTVTNTTGNSEIVGIDGIFHFDGGLNLGPGALYLDHTLLEAPFVTATANSVLAINVDSSGGDSTIVGDVDLQAGSDLRLTIGPNGSGALDVVGSVTLAGDLSINLLGITNTQTNYIPQPGDAFVAITTTGGVTGTFNLITDNVPGIAWTADYSDPLQVILRATSSAGVFLAADFNMDGMVDGTDLATWNANYGLMPATKAQGDANNDGKVDASDYMLWQRQKGQVSSTPTIGAVPEPAGAALAAIGLAALAAGRRRRAA